MATETKKNEGAEKGADSGSETGKEPADGTIPEGRKTESDGAAETGATETYIRGKSPSAERKSERAGSDRAARDGDDGDALVDHDNPYDSAYSAYADDDRRSGAGAAAAAVISGALGLISLTGSPLTDMVREHKQVTGQVDGAKSGGGGADQVKVLYEAPWHSAALVNGVIALLAVVVGGIAVAAVARRVEARTWVKGVAVGGLVLGVLGLVVAGGMYFDLFGSWPSMPPMPQQPQSPTG